MKYTSSNLYKYQSQNIIHRNPLQRLLVKLFLKKVTTLINQSKAKRILDIGCGEGIVISKLLKDNPILKITGIDLNPATVKQANERNSTAKFQTMDATRLKFKNNQFDLTLNLEILEHLKYPETAIKEAKRVSKKYCIFSVPHEPWFSILYLFIGKYLTRLGRHPEHINFWTKTQFHNLIKKHFAKTKVYSSFPWTIVIAKK